MHTTSHGVALTTYTYAHLHRLVGKQTRATYGGLVECLPADKPWDVVSATRRSSGVAPRACVRVYARVLVPPNLYIPIESTEGISEIWFCDPFPPWGVHIFGVMVRFTYG